MVAKIFDVLLMCCNEPEMRGRVITQTPAALRVETSESLYPSGLRHTHTQTQTLQERNRQDSPDYAQNKY